MSRKHSLTSLLSSLELDNYVALDIETTGLNPNQDSITEIAAFRFVNGEVKDSYTTLVNPEVPIPKNIIDITGITDEMLTDAPCIGDVLPELIKFLGYSSIVGHNIDFDYTFINKSCTRNNILFPDVPIYDTLSLARTFIYFYSSFSLTSLCAYYDISIGQAHRAGADAKATGVIFKYLLQEVLSHPLPLILKLDTILKNTKQVYNCSLFANIVKVAVSKNTIDGLTDPVSTYDSPKNIYSSDINSDNNQLPKSPSDWFSDDGLIAKNWKGYEKRLSQLAFIEDVYSAFSDNHILIAEAGTGLGKTLAYLSAGFLAAKRSNKSLVVSTYTKNLQEQLFTKDIPCLSQSLNVKINTVIYKGRHNYICQTRFQNIINNHTHLLKAYEYDALLALIVWEWETKTGDIYECNGFNLNKYKRLWSLVRSESGSCSMNQCRKYDGCYLGKLRNRVKDANIVIVNHSLFANELQRDNTSLPEEFIYVIDEAHHFADVIRDQLVQEFGINTLNDVFQYFDNNKKDWKISILKKYSPIYEIYIQLTYESHSINQELRSFFDSYCNNRSEEIMKSDYYVNKHLYRNSQEEFIDARPKPWDLLASLQSFKQNVQKFSILIIKHKEQLPQSILIEFDMVEACLDRGIDHFQTVLDTNNDNVKWASFIKRESQILTTLNSVPLKVKKFIYEHLLNCYPSGLFCSATLTVNEEFTYFSDKTGLDMAIMNYHVEEKIYPSPFHYSDQVKLFVYNHSMDVKDPAYIGNIAQQIDRISSALERRMLILCTSYKQTAALRKILEPIIKKDNRCLIVQKPGISRNFLVHQYLEHPHSILIGTASFWEGVDFPGDKVEILCIIKTPFGNPSDPLIQSQIEDYIQHGEDAFLEYQVPDAAMKLRQGFGRLIRNMTDTGICILMDTRLCRRQYGKIILDSLPVEAIPYQHIGTLISDSQKFF